MIHLVMEKMEKGGVEVRLVIGHLKRMESVVQPAPTKWGIFGMVQGISNSQLELDEEWVELMLCARDKGLTVEEVSKVLRILKEEGQALIQENVV